MSINGNEERTEIKFLIRDFEEKELEVKERYLERLAKEATAEFKGSSAEFRLKKSYRNMKAVIAKRPEAVLLAEEAIRASGIEPRKNPIRGGTDGARLSFMGIPTPNIFTGGHNFHGKKEWIAVQHMEKAAEVCLNLAKIWAEKGEIKGRIRE